jgi:hypothetical protein
MEQKELENYINSRMNTISVLLAHCNSQCIQSDEAREVGNYVYATAALLAWQVEPHREFMLSMTEAQKDKQNIINTLDYLLELFPQLKTNS